MKIFLLKSGLSLSNFDSNYLVTEGITGDIREANIVSGIIDNDFYITDLELLTHDFIRIIFDNKHHIGNRLQKGGVLLCFGGHLNHCPNYNNYSWLVSQFGLNLMPENVSGSDFNFCGSMPFIEDFITLTNKFTYNVIFNNVPVGNHIFTIAKNKGDKAISVYMEYGYGHIFILPRPQNVDTFVRLFIDKILPKLSVDFEFSAGSKDPMPEGIKALLVNGQKDLKIKMEEQTKIIEAENIKLTCLKDEYEQLEEWKNLIWQTGKPLENTVKKFFSFLGLELNNGDSSGVDLIGEYNGKSVYVEVKGREGCINHKEDFRQISERKLFESTDPLNTIALLVGNPFRLYPIDKRPGDEEESLFAKTSIKLAEDNNIGLIPTIELYKIVNSILNNPKLDKNKVLEDILYCPGLYQFEA